MARVNRLPLSSNPTLCWCEEIQKNIQHCSPTTFPNLMDGCCDICGDVGIAETIIACANCKVNQEHIYCMREYCEGPTKDWQCEECTKRNEKQLSCGNSQSASQVPPKTTTKDLQSGSPRKSNRGRGCVNWENKVLKGRTKYLSIQEVLTLPRQQNNSSNFKKTGYSSPLSPKKHPSTPRSRKKHSSSRLSPKKHSSTPLSPKKNISTPLSSKKHISTPTSRTAVNHEGSFIPNFQHPKKPRKVVKGQDVKNFSNDPVLYPSWKGSLTVCDTLNFHGLQAHHSSKACKKLMDFTKLLPEVLDFQLVPRGDVWLKLFSDYCPTRDDIGLFFLPGDMKRSKEYVTLLELIGEHDLVMRKQIENMEMLVFASTVLQEDCQKVRGKHFLWGLFYRAGKKEKAANVQHVVSDIKRTGGKNEGEVDDSEEADMEIDMVGGKSVGTVDVVMCKRSSDSQVQFDHSSINREQFQEIPPGFEKLWMASSGSYTSLNLKTEPCDDFPPGFKPLWTPGKP
ncbi:unnamed protein product [Cuscuta epithymum]|uniref:AIPP2-like SPOC-like domain-containing protein n=1 Tax=Cuscuta epithymum TaxID=186058 RepID=A0AAV0G7S6_9ASTE|nr:unnamed protein product [Cuscuta epithymum]